MQLGSRKELSRTSAADSARPRPLAAVTRALAIVGVAHTGNRSVAVGHTASTPGRGRAAYS